MSSTKRTAAPRFRFGSALSGASATAGNPADTITGAVTAALFGLFLWLVILKIV